MARARWPLLRDRPIIQVVLTLAQGGQQVTRTLLADTGAGNARAPFQLLLDEKDCLLCGGPPLRTIALRGAYAGSFPIYLINVEIPLLGFNDDLPAVGISVPPTSFDGIACFTFLNRFTYGNFGNQHEFGLEI